MARIPSRAAYVPPIRHWSYALTAALGRRGRSGPTICGWRSAVDQDRVDSMPQICRVQINQLADCERCITFIRRASA